jgi:dimethylglycine dehydrogenase
LNATAPGTLLEIDVYGKRHAATVQANAALWDPENLRLRA